MIKHDCSIKLPPQLSRDWHLDSVICFDSSQIVCTVGHTDNTAECILKIYLYHSFSIIKYHKFKKNTDKHLLTPTHVYSKFGNHYALFKKEDSLQQILCQTGLSLQQILLLGMDLCSAVELLIKRKCYDADISPTNIYRRADGCFCLGDLPLKKGREKGTPPYTDPSPLKIYRNKKYRFDQSMQYAICRLLKDLIHLQDGLYIDEIRQIIQIGTNPEPERRFSSIGELKKELSSLLEKNAETSYPILQIDHAETHPLFQVKTLPLPHKINPFVEFLCCLLFIIAGFFLLSSINQSVQRQNISQDTIVESKVQNPQVPVPDSTPLNSPGYPDLKNENSLDIQKKGYYSFSTVTQKHSDLVKYSCLYAGGNHFTNLESISDFKNLRELYLDENQITDISALSDCKEIRILVLSYNHITDVSALTCLDKLVHLDLSSNQTFMDISSLEQMHQLQILNISGTPLSKREVKQLSKKLPSCQIIY